MCYNATTTLSERAYFMTNDPVRLAVPVLPVALLHEQQSFCECSAGSPPPPPPLADPLHCCGLTRVIGGSTGMMDRDWLHRRPLLRCLGLVTAPPYRSEPSMKDVGFCRDLGSQVDNRARLPLLSVNGDLS